MRLFATLIWSLGISGWLPGCGGDGNEPVVPGGLPPAPREMLRAAFVATTKDPAFLTDIAKLNIPPGAVSASEVEDLLRGAAQVSPALVDRLRGVLTVE